MRCDGKIVWESLVKRIVFCWSGFPQYAARCVGAFAARHVADCIVVATCPRVPVEGMERLCGCEVRWIEPDSPVDCRSLFGKTPDAVLTTGWGVSAFNRLRDEVRSSGGRAYAMVDNNFIPSFKEFLKAARFRLFLKHKYDAFLVPGESGRKLLDFYGVESARVFKGMYAADDSLFSCVIPLVKRPRKILFVGQLCDRKNVLMLADAFLGLPVASRKGWTLEICGCGPQRDEIPSSESIAIRDFVQPEKLAELYRSARVFCLPSKEEHWGVVLHEAALSGCYILASRQTGAALDFVGKENGRVFDADSPVELARALSDAMALSDAELERAERESVCRSKAASLQRFADGCSAMIAMSR